ncbi:MAG: protein kinase [Myxococcota bacterium]|nr:protein kinase [Myxococcota bacterium]
MEEKSQLTLCPACDHPVDSDALVCPNCGFGLVGDPSPFEIGTILEGRYRIDLEVGRGGMGVVYRGIDLTLSRPVAIKAMLESKADAGVLARFMHEARSLASVEHEGLVPVYAVGQTDGVYYMVMKFVEGLPLGDHLQQVGMMPEDDVRQMLIQVCRALSALHGQGLVHRDMKPGNLIVGDDGSFTVMDLGIVKHIEEGAEATTSTATGTPRYMPPEMFSNGIVDGRADLYSLGIIAYRALTGVVPFDGPTPMAILYKQAHTEPAPLRSLNGSVSKEMAATVHRLLAKDPEARYANAEALTAVLSSTARRQSPGSYASLMLVVTLVVAAGIGYALYGDSSTNRAGDADTTVAPPVPVVTVTSPSSTGPSKDATVEPNRLRDARVVAKVPPKPDAALERVIFRIRSKPTGVEVYEGRKRVGRTPLRLIRTKSDGRQSFSLRKQGYRSTSFRLSLKKSTTVSKTLEPIIELLPQ